MTKKLTPFLKPNEVLSETEVDYLKEKSNFKGIALLFHAWFIIGLSVLVYSSSNLVKSFVISCKGVRVPPTTFRST